MMKLSTITGVTCGLLLSGLAGSAAHAALVATLTSNSSTQTLNGTLRGGYYYASDSSFNVGDFSIGYFSASSNSPSTPGNGIIARVKASTSFTAVNNGSGFEVLNINVADGSFQPAPDETLAMLAGAASVTFNSSGAVQSPLDYYQFTSFANSTSISSSVTDYNYLSDGSPATKNVSVGPTAFNLTSPYSLGESIALGLNPGDSATLTFQTDPIPVVTPLPSAGTILALGLAGLAGLALLRRKQFN